MTVKTTAEMLQKFGTDLAETELPNDVQCTKDLLTAHNNKHNNLKVHTTTLSGGRSLCCRWMKHICKHRHIECLMPVCVCVLQDELKLALKQGNTLLTCIRHQAAKSENQPLNPDEKENQTTVER